MARRGAMTRREVFGFVGIPSFTLLRGSASLREKTLLSLLPLRLQTKNAGEFPRFISVRLCEKGLLAVSTFTFFLRFHFQHLIQLTFRAAIIRIEVDRSSVKVNLEYVGKNS